MKQIAAVAACAVMATIISGCASTGRAMLLGAGLGAGAGSGAGMLVPSGKNGQYRPRNVIVGGALGALMGAGAGFVANELFNKSPKESDEKSKDEAQKSVMNYLGGGSQPNLLPAKVETRFVDDQVRGNVFIPAHVEYIIVEPARWSR